MIVHPFKSELCKVGLECSYEIDDEEDDGIVLKKQNDVDVDLWLKGHSLASEQDWRPRLFSKTKTESKCPFSFLFK